MRLRIQDIDLEQSQVVVPGAKGENDRLTMLLASLPKWAPVMRSGLKKGKTKSPRP